MPWNETKPMDQKTQFIADYLKDLFYFNELCERYGISRKTGYKRHETALFPGLLVAQLLGTLHHQSSI